MKYTEQLDWILDKQAPKKGIWDEESARENIDFVHSLGLKCDCVGWSKLNLEDSRVPEIFEKIRAFCTGNGWKARCIYTRSYVDVESDWFRLASSYLKDSTPAQSIQALTDSGDPIQVRNIRAFHEFSPDPKSWGGQLFVPERFRDACIRHNLDLEFCWAKDVGKYEAEQYFHVYGTHLLPGIATAQDIRDSRERLRAAGGWLGKLADVFHTLQMVTLPDCYLAQDLPKSGIVYAHIPTTSVSAGRYALLIHKDIARLLLKEKALPAGSLQPAPVVTALPGGYIYQETQPIPRPSRAYRDKLLADYEKQKATPRPARQMTEKEALKLLRSAKKERKADFQKAMAKSAAQALLESPHSPVVPYYLVADGGYLSDEYRLLPYTQALAENTAFHNLLQAEELLEEKPNGILIAQCPDGDAVL